ncbi:MAG: response regulator [Anaerolineae bacterium]|nr:response regulator [Anaerolineae bacterium]
MVVEDDIHLLEGIRDIMQLEGYDVLTAENGVVALKVLNEQATPPDLIISDIMMPLMDGIELLKQVRKEPRWLMIPFIFLTARGEKSDQHHGLRLGVDDYIVKPYDPSDLLVKIEARLQRHRAVMQAQHSGMSGLKRQILTMLNHEFRTPLTYIVAYADMLNNPGERKLSETELASYLRGVGSGAERLRKLVENFILLVDLEAGDAQTTYEWRKFPINDVHVLITEACERVTELKDYVVKTEVEAGIPIFTGDSEYLTVALAQLLNNATKFSAPGTNVTIGARVDHGKVLFWVHDEGRGIPKVEQSRIWESFYQINRALNEDQGAGAGLAIVKGVVNLHGGLVGVESEEGQGSTFKIWIPLDSTPAG